jgi:2-amino-4-hydroxy-6-hydroxymethyldihydropteridine diphosphokinase
MLTQAFLGIGSNLGDRCANVSMAMEAIRASADAFEASSLYETAPRGFTNQPPFINAACMLWTPYSPFELLHAVHRIESSMDRRRVFPNAPRTIDIDILMYGSLRLQSPSLCLPHPRMASRDFVLAPLAEIAPFAVEPDSGKTIIALLRALPTGGPRPRAIGKPDV